MIQQPAIRLGWIRETRYFMDKKLLVQTRPVMGLNGSDPRATGWADISTCGITVDSGISMSEF